MKMKKIFFLILYCFVICLVSCNNKDDNYIPPAIEDPDIEGSGEKYNKLDFPLHNEGEPFNTYRGLVMTGYQGWFCAQDEESDCLHDTPYHYASVDGRFEPGVLKNNIDFWPDVSEYRKTYERK